LSRRLRRDRCQHASAQHLPGLLPLESRALLSGGHDAEPLDVRLPSEPIDNSPPASAVTAPLSAVPQLSSYPSSNVRVFLDFNGAPATTWGSFAVPATPAYDTDGDATTFSATEVEQIREMHARVAEKYSPFNVNVTTVDPGTYPYYETVRVVVGGDGAWTNAVYGGYGYVDGFFGSTSNTAWVFAKNLGQGRPKYVAEAAAHEAGHNFGLNHQSLYGPGNQKLEDYNRGTAASAPVMGASYFSERGVWWNGPTSAGPFSKQSDLAVLSSALGYRPDDFADAPDLAAWLTSSPGDTDAAAAGVIETLTDVDLFRFHSSGGLAHFRADVAPFGAMLDLKLTLTDAAGHVLATADTTSLGESLSYLIEEGEYFLAVASHGGYGDLGQYAITGSTVPEPAGVAAATIFGAAWLCQRRGQRGPSARRARVFATRVLVGE
jgi:hypothetical protein